MSNKNQSSYEKINYSLRPAKSIERKMLCEVMKRLSVFYHLNKYRYVGMGSPYFSDFILVHKTLGINKLISIEQDEENSERFDFNRPYSCVKIHFDHSNVVLPKIQWHEPTILWLDFDSKLQATMFQDISTFFSQAKTGSMFIISVNVQPDTLPPSDSQNSTKELKKHRIELLTKRIGSKRLPPDIDSLNLSGNVNNKVIYQIIIDQINEELKTRNGVLNPSEYIKFKQLVNFQYKDGAEMLTVGGIIYQSKQKPLIDALNLDQLDFVREKEESFKIVVPSLTLKEIRSLDSNLPDNINTKLGKLKRRARSRKNRIPELSSDDVINYSKIYRYFPTFAEAYI